MSFEKPDTCGYYKKDDLKQAAENIKLAEDLVKAHKLGWRARCMCWILRKIRESLTRMSDKVDPDERKD